MERWLLLGLIAIVLAAGVAVLIASMLGSRRRRGHRGQASVVSGEHEQASVPSAPVPPVTSSPAVTPAPEASDGALASQAARLSAPQTVPGLPEQSAPDAAAPEPAASAARPTSDVALRAPVELWFDDGEVVGVKAGSRTSEGFLRYANRLLSDVFGADGGAPPLMGTPPNAEE